MAGLACADHRDVSLTDWSSFVLMRRHGFEEAFTFDRHFRQQGFTVVPPAPAAQGGVFRDPKS